MPDPIKKRAHRRKQASSDRLDRRKFEGNGGALGSLTAQHSPNWPEVLNDSEGLRQVLDELAAIAAYDGPWEPLRAETPLLKTRVEELSRREQQLDELLTVALVGGSGVGKSTLLNALAGDELAESSPYRPCTSVPIVYHPPGARVELGDCRHIAGSALEHLVIVDTPDSDTIILENRARVIEALHECDLILICSSPEKYLNEATWSLLRPLQSQHTMVCVETKAGTSVSNGVGGIREHWLGRMRAEGFEITAYFAVNALHALDRKLAGDPPGPDEGEFPALERFLREELDRERIQRIKKSNVAGLLRSTLRRLDEQLAPYADELERLESILSRAESEAVRATFESIQTRLFSESHLWNYALGREMNLRAKGIAGTLFRVLETVRTLPARASGWFTFKGRMSLGRHAAAVLTDRELVQTDLTAAFSEVESLYAYKRSELTLAMAKAGFTLPENDGEFDTFIAAVQERVDAVLRGPARNRLVHLARGLTNWPATLLADAPILVVAAYVGYRMFTEFFSPTLLPGAFLINAAAVLGMTVAVELFALSLLTRSLAWAARRTALRDFRAALDTHASAFPRERRLLEDTRALMARLESLNSRLRGPARR